MTSLVDDLGQQELVAAQFTTGANTNQTNQLNQDVAGSITSISSNTLTISPRSGGNQAIELPQGLAPASNPTFNDLAVASLQVDTVKVTKLLTGSGTIDFPSTLAQASGDATITVTGAAVGDFVIPIMPSPPSGCAFVCLGVTAPDTISFRFVNPTAAPVDPASGTFSALLIRL